MPHPDNEILLVDDNPSDVELTIHALQHNGLTASIRVAEDGKEALDYIFCRGSHQDRRLSDRPRVIFLDLKMPKVDGLAVLEAIRSDERSSAIPVVILTSSKEPRDVAAAYKLGTNAFVQKPVDFGQFRRTIQEMGKFWLTENEPPPPEAFANDAKADA
jgi:two-component system, response regulator